MKNQIYILILFFLSYNAVGLTKDKYAMNSNCEKDIRKIISEKYLQSIGLEVVDLTDQEKKTLGVKEGIKVIHINEEQRNDVNKMRKGFIILRLNNVPVVSKEQFSKIISTQNESIVMLEGVYMEAPSVCCYYAFEIN